MNAVNDSIVFLNSQLNFKSRQPIYVYEVYFTVSRPCSSI